MIDAFNKSDKAKASLYFSYFNSLIHMIDAVLECHPHFRLEEWSDYAEKMAGDNDDLRKHYVENSRFLVTTWADFTGNTLSDYASKMWSGLLRDYYFSRWEVWFNGKMADRDEEEIVNDVHKFESDFRYQPNLSRSPIPKDAIKASRDLVIFADSIDLDNFDWD